MYHNVNMDKIYSAGQVAEYFIDKAHKEGRVITNKKLQKVIYYAQAWSLALRDKPIFKDQIEAWIHGPVVNSVYQKYKKYGFGTIEEKVDVEGLFTENEKKFLDNVWRVYGKKDAEYLELLTHNEEPWQLAREGVEQEKKSKNVISHKLMKIYYRKLLADIKK